MGNLDVTSMCDRFYSSLHSALNSCTPTVDRSRSDYPDWFTRSIIEKIKLKNKYREKLKRSDSLPSNDPSLSLRADIKLDIKAAYKNYLINVQSKIKSDPKSFWKHVNAVRMNSRIPCVMHYNDISINDSADIVNAFANFFLVFTHPLTCFHQLPVQYLRLDPLLIY